MNFLTLRTHYVKCPRYGVNLKALVQLKTSTPNKYAVRITSDYADALHDITHAYHEYATLDAAEHAVPKLVAAVDINDVWVG